MVLIYFKMPLISPKYSDPAICTWLRKVGDEKIKACRAMLRSYHRITQKCTQLQGIIPGPLSRKSQRECFLACMIMCDFVILWNILLCNSVEERHLIKLSIHLPQREFYLKNAISSPALNVDRFFFPQSVQQFGWQARIKYHWEVWRLGKLRSNEFTIFLLSSPSW